LLNIVIPMAGAGSRFAKNGYKDPKPLILVHGVPMIKLVIDNLCPTAHHRFIFICQNAHIAAYGLREKLASWAPGSIVIGIDGVTDGAACTVLAAKQYIDNGDALMIANSDQYVDVDINAYLAHMAQRGLDGIIMTMEADDPKWSFVGLDEAGGVNRVVEKEVISNEATVGIYNFAHGRDFVSAAEAMIAADERVNGEFYVAPVYNRQIKVGGKVGIYNIGKDRKGMYGLGIPVDLEDFLLLPISQRAAKVAG
jgi:dTDP-glucose pyrophosphorylase